MRSYHENRGQGNIFILLCEGRAGTITGGAAGEARKGKGNESFRRQVGRSNGGEKIADPGGSALLTGCGFPKICEIEIELN